MKRKRFPISYKEMIKNKKLTEFNISNPVIKKQNDDEKTDNKKD